MTYEHFVLIKFNVRWEDKPLWTSQEVKKRIELFKKTAGAGLLSQTEQTFKTILFIGDYTPHYLTLMLKELCDEYNMIPSFISDSIITPNKRGNAILRNINTRHNASHFILTRLDSDNILSKDHIESIQREVLKQEVFIEKTLEKHSSVFLSFPFGYGKFLNDPFVYEFRYVSNAFFSMVVPSKNILTTNGYLNEDGYSKHMHIGVKFTENVITINNVKPKWVFFLHENNVRMKKGTLKLNKKNIKETPYQKCFEVLEDIGDDK